MTQWQPIESAPIDKRILIFAPRHEVSIGKVRPDGLVVGEHERFIFSGATHWMPLPKHPKKRDFKKRDEIFRTQIMEALYLERSLSKPPKTRAQVEGESAEEGYAYDP